MGSLHLSSPVMFRRIILFLRLSSSHNMRSNFFAFGWILLFADALNIFWKLILLEFDYNFNAVMPLIFFLSALSLSYVFKTLYQNHTNHLQHGETHCIEWSVCLMADVDGIYMIKMPFPAFEHWYPVHLYYFQFYDQFRQPNWNLIKWWSP